MRRCQRNVKMKEGEEGRQTTRLSFIPHINMIDVCIARERKEARQEDDDDRRVNARKMNGMNLFYRVHTVGTCTTWPLFAIL